MPQPLHPVFRPGATALITGAASGIGLATAQFCRTHGMNLILIDNNKEALETAASTLPSSSNSTTTTTHHMDVSNLSDWQTLHSSITTTHPQGIDLLFLNAGASIQPTPTIEGHKNPWTDATYFQRTLAINTLGYTNGIATFIDDITSKHGTPAAKAIILTGSKQGITNPPGNDPAYNASKAAVKSIAEQLSYTLYDQKHANVSVHLLIPGFTYTGLVKRHFTEKPAGAWMPEQVVEYLSQGMAEGRFYIVCPDNEVSEELDKKRMLWACGDVVFGRPALTRWREDWKERAARGVEEMEISQ
ncbi:hypothetical protein ASPBRDRAFT_46623 [Aspergillus brasiliensis CBS 101740]|uniref:NAD(P)-binding protein n=1 Tax=Aspergillus brasiliensis (strain CBS 101740 / IMI 381727 / IBT 21946) TaxID=767769 RepID=A0A1L9U9W2_ASPBC|nr:hypothetical protein ASPBRDRAFT_46623 [Aspergillus brasiliensis CBS 101740]